MSTQTHTFFITAASGNQGGAVARQLLAAGHFVKALVRDESKSSSQNLAKLGASLIVGDYLNLDALKAGAEGCHGMYINPSPTDPPTDALLHARNLIAAAKSAGVTKVVCSTVVRAEEHLSFPMWAEWEASGSFMVGYWRTKAAIQALVQEAGFESWTILQPANLMTNWLPPLNPFLWRDGELLSAYGEETDVPLTGFEDVGAFAVKAFTDSEGDLEGKVVRVVSDALKVGEMAAVIRRVAGVQVGVHELDEGEIEEEGEKNPTIPSQLWQRYDEGNKFNFGECKKFDIEMTSFRDLMEAHKAEVVAAFAK